MSARSIFVPFDAVATSAGAGSPVFKPGCVSAVAEGAAVVGSGTGLFVVDDSTFALAAVGCGVGVGGGAGFGAGGSLHAETASDETTTNERAARRRASVMARMVVALRCLDRKRRRALLRRCARLRRRGLRRRLL